MDRNGRLDRLGEGPDSARRPPPRRFRRTGRGRHIALVSGGGRGRPGRGRRPDPTPAARRLRGLSRTDRRRRVDPGHEPRGAPAAGRPRARARGSAARRSRRAGARRARAGGRSRGRDPHRPSRSGRSAARGRLHDRGREPRRRDLGLEHRDRRDDDRRARRTARTPSPVGPHCRGDRRLRGVRRAVAVRRAGRRNGRVGAARPRARTAESRDRGARARGRRAARARSGVHRRRRVPPFGSRDRRPHGLGNAARRSPGGSGAGSVAGVALRVTRRLARRPGGDPAGDPPVVRALVARVARRESRRRAARRTEHGGRSGRPRGRARHGRRHALIRRHPRRSARVGAARRDRRSRSVRRRTAVRQRHPRTALGRRRGDPLGRDRCRHRPSRWRHRRLADVAPATTTGGPSALRSVPSGPRPATRTSTRSARTCRGHDGPRSCRRRATERQPERDGPRCRSGRRDPRRERQRPSPPRRRRPQPDRARPGPRRAPAAMGPPDRHPRPHAPARRPCRGARAVARPVPRRARVRAGHDRAGARLQSLDRGTRRRRSAARHAVDRRPVRVGLDPVPRALARSGSSAGAPRGRRDRDQQRFHRPSRHVRYAQLPPRRRYRAGGRSRAARPGPATSRALEGRPPRLEDRQHRAVPRSGASAGRRRVGGARQSLRPPGARHDRPAPGDHPAHVSDRHRRDRRGPVRGRRAAGPHLGTTASGDGPIGVSHDSDGGCLCLHDPRFGWRRGRRNGGRFRSAHDSPAIGRRVATGFDPGPSCGCGAPRRPDGRLASPPALPGPRTGRWARIPSIG